MLITSGVATRQQCLAPLFANVPPLNLSAKREPNVDGPTRAAEAGSGSAPHCACGPLK
jgi:hypothetical protein